MKTDASESPGRGPAFRWSYYPIDASKPLPLHVDDLQVDVLPRDLCVKHVPIMESELYDRANSGHQPFFHAFSSELGRSSTRRHYLHVSCSYTDRPFLWLSHSQYKTCRQRHSHFYRAELVPFRDGLGARWHRFIYVVSYDFTKVHITARNDSNEFDSITGMVPFQNKKVLFSLTTKGELPIIASNLRRQRHVIDIL